MQRVFVYGTLKVGEPNHYWLKNPENGYSKFLGNASTSEKYPLIIGTKYNIPFLLFSPGKGNLVQGEVYEVDEKMLIKLDELEDHPNYYVRDPNTVKLHLSGVEKEIECWIYFLKNFSQDFLKNTMYSCYSAYGDHRLPYIDRSQRDLKYMLEQKEKIY